ncbi:MAG: DUF4199 domain-containing protein [Calditrichaeota bacterium]|nr:DUF4199 domain-containing protein [Candidatus Cloacimonadota bacterium]MCA9788011.1 DUF4199 domain-containing protein [Candidatus Cloacimonadota bacterium]MCB1048561.1 DUF4199 domain-containing protein [Calditrichota bacterium]MCB9472501.1 DUF4199 domain-containing protein [Candidatus Delongbacteria bacterium]
MFRSALFGLAITAFVVAHTLVTYPASPSNEPGSWWAPFLILGVVFAGVYLGILEARRREPNGQIRYAQAMRTGLVIGLVSGVGTGSFFWLYFGRLNPDFLPALLAQQETLFHADSLAADVIADRLAMLEQRFSPAGQFFSNMASMLFFSMAFSVLSSFLLGRGVPEMDDNRSEYGNGSSADPRFTPARPSSASDGPPPTTGA